MTHSLDHDHHALIGAAIDAAAKADTNTILVIVNILTTYHPRCSAPVPLSLSVSLSLSLIPSLHCAKERNEQSCNSRRIKVESTGA